MFRKIRYPKLIARDDEEDDPYDDEGDEDGDEGSEDDDNGGDGDGKGEGDKDGDGGGNWEQICGVLSVSLYSAVSACFPFRGRNSFFLIIKERYICL